MGEARRRGTQERRALQAYWAGVVRQEQEQRNAKAQAELHRLGFHAPFRPRKAALVVAIAVALLGG